LTDLIKRLHEFHVGFGEVSPCLREALYLKHIESAIHRHQSVKVVHFLQVLEREIRKGRRREVEERGREGGKERKEGREEGPWQA